MGDHIRAAMTCIRFYQENTSNFSDLLNNAKYLMKAKKHLADLLEQDQWVEVSQGKLLSNLNQDLNNLVFKEKLTHFNF